MREILDIKHGGLEKYGFYCHDLGTSVPVSKVLVDCGQKERDASIYSCVPFPLGLRRPIPGLSSG
jgi:D-ornithine 4,5-aminomutase subunit beta